MKLQLVVMTKANSHLDPQLPVRLAEKEDKRLSKVGMLIALRTRNEVRVALTDLSYVFSHNQKSP